MAENYNFGLISQHIGRLFGLHFSERQLESMGHNVMKAAMELKRDPKPESLQKWLANSSLSKAELDALARHLSVGETYFFRENAGLELFKNEIIPSFIKQDPGQEIRIWSAGCSSGEEPYTLAMLLHERIPDFRNRKIRILASDFNTEAIKKAQKGLYTAWSFRETPEAYKNKYFTSAGKHFEIKKEIRQMVTFFQLNLARSAYPSAKNGTENLDVIFCRNVLMYFLPEMAIAVANRFYHALKQDAWLITSQVELHEEYYATFQKLKYKQGIFYRKSRKEEKINLFSDNFTGQTAGFGKDYMKASAPKKPKANQILKWKEEVRQKISLQKDKAVVKSEQPATLPTGKPDAEKKAEKLYEEAEYSACSEFCMAFFKKNPFKKSIGAFLAGSLANLGMHEEARHWGEKLIAADGENTAYLNLFATILMEQGDMRLAEKTLIKTLYLEPNHAAGLFNMHVTLHALGKNKLAGKYYNNLLLAIAHLEDHAEIPGLEGMTAGVVRSLAKNNVNHE